jgi:sarcosine oxidase, subunit gamma
MSKPWLQSLPAATRFAFQGDATARAAAAAIWGVPFSNAPCRANTTGARATLWLGPQEFLLLDEASSNTGETLAALEAISSRLPCSVVDVSQRQLGWEISGARAETILAGACPLDLDPAHFPIGMCTRTLFGKAEILLWRREDQQFHLECWRSFAGYVEGLLTEIDSGYGRF